MRSIHRWLLVSLIVGSTAMSVIAAYGIFRTAREEAGELFDYELRTVAISLPQDIETRARAESPTQEFQGIADDRILIEIRDRAGQSIYRSSNNVVLPVIQRDGFDLLTEHGQPWRVFGVRQANRFVMVAQPLSIRDDLALTLAWRTLWPLAILVPAIIVWVLFVVARGLAPVERLSKMLDGRSVSALTPLPSSCLPTEIRPLVDALNGLLQRVDDASMAHRTFIGDAAHELRTPLTALKLQLQAATADGSLQGDDRTIQSLETRLNRLIHLAEQLLVMAREDANGGVSMGQVGLRALAEQSVADFSLIAELHGIDLGLECVDALDGDTYTVMGDRNGLSILLNNLIENAIRHTPRDGRIDLVLRRQGKEGARIDVLVVDEGSGIPDAELDRVRDRFYRGEGARGAGSGLGLAIASSIAERHAVTLELRNRDDRSGLIAALKGLKVSRQLS